MAILSPVIEVRGEEATIEAGFFAAKLGLSLDRLRAEMRRGIVYGVVERGVGEDEGRLRLTFRRRAARGRARPGCRLRARLLPALDRSRRWRRGAGRPVDRAGPARVRAGGAPAMASPVEAHPAVLSPLRRPRPGDAPGRGGVKASRPPVRIAFGRLQGWLPPPG